MAFKYITTYCICEKCQKKHEFSDDKNTPGMRFYRCQHFIIKFIRNTDENKFKYLVSLKCCNCSKKQEIKEINITQSYDKNNKNLNYNNFSCCQKIISIGAFLSEGGTKTINKIIDLLDYNNLRKDSNIFERDVQKRETMQEINNNMGMNNFNFFQNLNNNMNELKIMNGHNKRYGSGENNNNGYMNMNQKELSKIKIQFSNLPYNMIPQNIWNNNIINNNMNDMNNNIINNNNSMNNMNFNFIDNMRDIINNNNKNMMNNNCMNNMMNNNNIDNIIDTNNNMNNMMINNNNMMKNNNIDNMIDTTNNNMNNMMFNNNINNINMNMNNMNNNMLLFNNINQNNMMKFNMLNNFFNMNNLKAMNSKSNKININMMKNLYNLYDIENNNTLLNIKTIFLTFTFEKYNKQIFIDVKGNEKFGDVINQLEEKYSWFKNVKNKFYYFKGKAIDNYNLSLDQLEIGDNSDITIKI